MTEASRRTTSRLDPATCLGLAGGTAVLVGALLLGGSARVFVDLPALLIVLGGTLAATALHHPAATLLSAAGQARKVLTEPETPSHELVDEIVRCARLARREGLVALEERMREIRDPFLQRALQLLADGFAPEIVRDVLEVEDEHERVRLEESCAVFERMAGYAPAFGMIGTIFGLVHMLNALQDPRRIGAGMAVALLTTLYGAVLANLVFAPLAGKLAARARHAEGVRRLLLQGALAIQAGEQPTALRERLRARAELAGAGTTVESP